MKLKYLLGGVFLFLALTIGASAAPYSTVEVEIFIGEGCRYCAKTEAYLEQLQKTTYPNIVINKHEVYRDADNQKLFINYAEVYKFTPDGVPFTIIGNAVIGGADLNAIDAQLEFCKLNSCPDPSAIYSNYFEGRDPNAPSKAADIDTTKYENMGWIIIFVVFIAIASVAVVSIKNKDKN